MASLEKHPISGVHKITISAHAHVWNDPFWSSAILNDVLMSVTRFSPSWPLFRFLMGPMDPSVEDPGKNTAF